MKTYAEIKKEVRENYEEQKKLEKENETLRSELRNVPFEKRLSQIEECKKVRAKVEENTIKIERLEVVNSLLRNNQQIALFNEVMPIILEVLEKYNGKRLGEKTLEKLKNEIKEKTNCGFYIHRNSYHIMQLSKEGYTYGEEIEVSPKVYDTKLLDDNKVQIVPMDELKVVNTIDYIENVNEYADKLKSMKNEAIALQKKLRDICSAYNHAVPAFMEPLNDYKTIY